MSVDEKIILVDKHSLFNEGKTLFQGTLFNEEKVDGYLEVIEENWQIMRRGGVHEENLPPILCAERNQEFKQPIPYIIISKDDKFYVTERLEGAGESRLHGKLSMGIGGHMNPIEGFDSFDALLIENTIRELNEELSLDKAGEDLHISMGGLLNDDSNEVGQVHIGLLGQLRLEKNQTVEIKEVDQLKGNWYTLDELLSPEVFPRIESWGKIVVEAIKEKEFKI